MTLVDLVDRFRSVDRSLVVLNRTEPDPIYNMLEDTFGDDTLDVSEADDTRLRGSDNQIRETDGGPFASLSDRTVAHRVRGLLDSGGVALDDAFDKPDVTVDEELLEADDGAIENLAVLVEEESIVAASPLEKLVNAILLVNSDLYTTGSRGLEAVDLPAVITGLNDAVFTLRGYPESNRQKLLLITISRFIERVAWEADSGSLHSSFQRLSRLDDEIGTRRVYEKLANSGVETHVYGVPDRVPSGLDVMIHGGHSIEYTDTWFVLFRPAGGPRPVEASDDLDRGRQGGIGLLAVENDSRLWRGIWTFDTDRLETIGEHINDL